ncbi:hypothetical protein EXIGLDRAFT_529405 [Exidia glandulosa HHB12029]|uniref:Uncharacterized protein n=1 Tax=Exidia glandulosa HHB12029 TaxID=1314781 RepID=A0A165IXA8_EXIGL|nr:hypothetical protein EXIGLDRAFT_529405 [Exidia glandulosa HHB12029]
MTREDYLDAGESFVAPVVTESILHQVYQDLYPPLAAHALLHGHINAGRLVHASALYYVQVKRGTKFKARSLEALVDALCPSPSTLPGLPFSPTIDINSTDSVSIFGDAVERMSRDVDLGTAMALVLVNTAREAASPRNTASYRRIVDSLLLQNRISTAANVYAQLVRDWHFRIWLSGASPHSEPLNDPVPAPALPQDRTQLLNARVAAPETDEDAKTSPAADQDSSDAAEESSQDLESSSSSEAMPSNSTEPSSEEASNGPETETDALLLDIYKPEDITPAREMRLDDPTFILPMGNKLLGRIIRAILYPEAVDMRKPDRRFTTAPRWDKDAIIATFVLVELLERRQIGARDISGLLKIASEAPEKPNFPIKLFRGGKLHRVKPYAHIESVLRALMREPPMGERRTQLYLPGTDIPAPPDMLRPLTIEAYNQLLLFGLTRRVSEFELHSLADSMKTLGVEPNQETDEVLFRRTKLAQNRLVDELLARMPRPRQTDSYLEERGVRDRPKFKRRA